MPPVPAQLASQPLLTVVSRLSYEDWYGPITAVSATALGSIADLLADSAGATSHVLVDTADCAGGFLTLASDGGSDGETAIFRLESAVVMRAPGDPTIVSGIRRDTIRQIRWQVLGTVTATLSTKTGVAGGIIDDTALYADTMTLTTNRGYEGQLVLCPDPSSADNSPTQLKIDMASRGLLRVVRVTGGTSAEADPWYVGFQKFTAQ